MPGAARLLPPQLPALLGGGGPRDGAQLGRTARSGGGSAKLLSAPWASGRHPTAAPCLRFSPERRCIAAGRVCSAREQHRERQTAEQIPHFSRSLPKGSQISTQSAQSFVLFTLGGLSAPLPNRLNARSAPAAVTGPKPPHEEPSRRGPARQRLLRGGSARPHLLLHVPQQLLLRGVRRAAHGGAGSGAARRAEPRAQSRPPAPLWERPRGEGAAPPGPTRRGRRARRGSAAIFRGSRWRQAARPARGRRRRESGRNRTCLPPPPGSLRRPLRFAAAAPTDGRAEPGPQRAALREGWGPRRSFSSPPWHRPGGGQPRPAAGSSGIAAVRYSWKPAAAHREKGRGRSTRLVTRV